MMCLEDTPGRKDRDEKEGTFNVKLLVMRKAGWLLDQKIQRPCVFSGFWRFYAAIDSLSRHSLFMIPTISLYPII